jgi:glycosyltransferase involved in cell wall biosynthesis
MMDQSTPSPHPDKEPSRGLVSVIIPAYNQGRYLGKAIQSVLDQTYPHLEAIIVDDGSTDDSAEVARSFHDPRLHYVYQDNRGLSAARNTGVRYAHGEYLAYLDSDDLFLPRKLELLAGILDANPDLGFAAGQAVPIDENDQPLGHLFDSPPPEDPSRLLLGNPFHVGSVLVRARWQTEAGGFDETLRSYEDWDMWLRLVLLGCQMGWADEPVSLYRFHTAQMTRLGSQMTRATFAVLDKIFAQSNLPDSWQEKHDLAYSNANLRAMAQAYQAQEYALAQKHLCEAVRLNPSLLDANAEPLAKRLAALADSPKNREPLDFLERIYSHLPSELDALQQRSSVDLGNAAVDYAYRAYAKRDYVHARQAAHKALHHQPGWLRNRGVLAVLMKAYARPVLEYIFSS